MYNHAPKDYHCPFCLLISGVKNEHSTPRKVILFITTMP